MIRGACILAVGFALGYSKAISEMPEIQAAIQAIKIEWYKAGDESDTNTEGETPQ